MTRQLALLLLRLAISIAAPLGVSLLGYTITIFERVLLTIAIFLVLTGAETLLSLKDLQGRKDRELVLWRVEDDFDKALSNIREDFRTLLRRAYGSKDLYVDHFRLTIEELAKAIRTTTEAGTLPLKNFHFRSIEMVLAAFEGSPYKIFRELWVLSPGEPLWNDLSREYFAQLALMAKKGQIKGVRTIFLFTDPTFPQQKEVRDLLAFYANWKGFDCRLVRQEACDSLMRDEGIAQSCIDFGIYADRYLFKTIRYQPEVEGVFVRDSAEIQRYTRFFDNLWSSAAAKKNAEPARKISLEEIVGPESVRAAEH